MPDFILLDLWPLNSLDLNPVHCHIRTAMQECVYHTDMHGGDQLKQRPINSSCGIDQHITDTAVDQCKTREAYVRANVEHTV